MEKGSSQDFLIKWGSWIALFLLSLLAFFLFSASHQDSLTIDELSHLPAGISYVTQQDYRLNPEHPPLQKILAGFAAVTAVHPKVPLESRGWTDETNGQWSFGTDLLFNSGNDANQLTFWGRLPTVVLTVLFGFLLFYWTKRTISQLAAVIVLALYALSPSIIAHGHLVTFDVGAAFGYWLAFIALLSLLKRPSWLSALLLGLALSFVLLIKFSAILLIPIFTLLSILWLASHPSPKDKSSIAKLLSYGLVAALTILIAIWLAYRPLIANYPALKNSNDAQSLTANFNGNQLQIGRLAVRAITIPILRPYGEYLLGLSLTVNRAAYGNTNYFLGTINNQGSSLYFPILFFTKESLTALILIAEGLGLFVLQIIRERNLQKSFEKYFIEISLLIVIIAYWVSAITSPLNIGIRHILPTIPLIFLFTGITVSRLFLNKKISPHFGTIMLALLLLEGLVSYPYFISRYNLLAGGTSNGYKIAVDSNYDWGQDLKRLAAYTQKNKIDQIALDYYGTADPHYYLGERFVPWWSARGVPSGYFAVSISKYLEATALHKNVAPPAVEDSYAWLKDQTPVARVGTTLLLYRFP